MPASSPASPSASLSASPSAAGGRAPGAGRTRRLRLLATACAAVALSVTAALPAVADTPSAPPAPVTAASAGATAGHTAAGSPSLVRPNVPGGSVTQDAVPLVIGGTRPVTTTFTATLPAGAHGPVSAIMAFGEDQMPPAGGYTWRIAAGLASTCSVNDGPFVPCDWRGGSPGEEPVGPYDEYLRLILPTVEAAPTITYRIRIASDPYGVAGERLTGFLLVSDADGGALADGGAAIQFRTAADSPYYRPALYAVDGSGVMWRYDGTAPGSAAPFQPRARVGAGWGVYTAITPLIGTTAAGSGDVVARDSAGVLWYYRQSGNPAQPFQPRVRVGAGWNIYTAIAGTGGGTLDELADQRSGDLVARDSGGVLWLYRATGDPAAPFAPRVRVGSGWNAYSSITTSQDGVIAREPSGVVWRYNRHHTDTGSEPFAAREQVNEGWNIYTALSGAGADGQLLLGRDAAGKLWSLNPVGSNRTLVGGGWNIYSRLF
ncbi:tachylectin-related carbohydrate-binding protein [Actinacidiphila acidipaludis]|uniref:Secreted protein n=1 Tax=Actinacidiphila acidipaludis TaxID=2873382 RepID=A0ABS7QA08_9ACTN|nr:tachylectin-related carbohydrate-binding protein [Streptomyces acidipaludis]MBY8879798.1 hypothetical protein [Streptomyces acidipaludis]